MLSGNAQELRQLSEYGLPLDYFRIWGGVDHWNDCPNDHFSFNSVYFHQVADQQTVWQISYELLSLYNGASELFERGYQKLTIHGINLQERQTDYQERMQIVGLLGPPSISQSKRDVELRNALRTSAQLGLMILATENEDVYMILKFLDLDRGWIGYYKLLDTIETWERRKGIRAERSKRQEKRFTNTANNYDLSGFDARHGFQERLQENKLQVMSLEDGHTFITSVVKSYLKAAYPQYLKFK
jgi:hypothetical protein